MKYTTLGDSNWRLLGETGRLEELVVATKVRFPMGPGPDRSGLSREHVVQACAASPRRLGLALSPEEIAVLEAPCRPHAARGIAGPAPSAR